MRSARIRLDSSDRYAITASNDLRNCHDLFALVLPGA